MLRNRTTIKYNLLSAECSPSSVPFFLPPRILQVEGYCFFHGGATEALEQTIYIHNKATLFINRRCYSIDQQAPTVGGYGTWFTIRDWISIHLFQQRDYFHWIKRRPRFLYGNGGGKFLHTLHWWTYQKIGLWRYSAFIGLCTAACVGRRDKSQLPEEKPFSIILDTLSIKQHPPSNCRGSFI